MASEPPKVLISYSHDSPEHEQRVLTLADRLRAEGIDCMIDQYVVAPAEGWPRWMDKQIRESDFVLMVYTETYCRRVLGEEDAGRGRGVPWDGHLIYEAIHQGEMVNRKFIPVLFESGQLSHIPDPLRHTNYYDLSIEDGYEDLYRRLTNQTGVDKPELGKLRGLPPAERNPLFTRREREEKERLQTERLEKERLETEQRERDRLAHLELEHRDGLAAADARFLLGVSANASEMEIEAAYRDRASAVRKQFADARDHRTREKCKREHAVIEEARSKLLRDLKDQEPPEESQRLSADPRQREENQRLAAEQRQGEENQRLAAEQRQGEENQRLAAEQRQREESHRLAAEQRQGEERVSAPVSDASQAIDRVNFSVFAPGVIRPAQQFLLDLWVHLPTQTDEVTSMIREFARDRRLGVKPRVAVVRGAALSVVLDLPSLRIKDPSNTIFWNGEPDYASFVVEVPADVAIGDYPGRVIITASGIPIAKITFCLPIEAEGTRVEKVPRELPTGRHQPHSAFASFSGRDRKDVLGRVQGMTKVCQDLDVFVDVLSLRSGQYWEAQIRQQIPARDVFFLFWSFHASRSKEVEKEWRIALEMRGLDFIDPIPLTDPRVSPPPKELARLHFNDLYIAQIQMEESLKKLRKCCWWEFWRP